MTLSKAFYRGEVSYELWNLWVRHNQASSCATISARMGTLPHRIVTSLLILALLICWCTLVVPFMSGSRMFRYPMIIAGVCTFLGYCGMDTLALWKGQRDFLRDVRRLTLYTFITPITHLGSLGSKELRSFASDQLVKLAGSILAAESEDRSSKTLDQLRLEFRKAHEAFLCFDLVERKWEMYFNQAKRGCSLV